MLLLILVVVVAVRLGSSGSIVGGSMISSIRCRRQFRTKISFESVT